MENGLQGHKKQTICERGKWSWSITGRNKSLQKLNKYLTEIQNKILLIKEEKRGISKY